LTVAELAGKIVPGEEWMAEDEYRFANLGYYWQDLVDLISAEQVRSAEAELLDAARAILCGLAEVGTVVDPESC
jgi:hypothetical protein